MSKVIFLKVTYLKTCFFLIQILELVNKHPLKQEFSTQTALHIQPAHVFDEETFFKRYIEKHLFLVYKTVKPILFDLQTCSFMITFISLKFLTQYCHAIFFKNSTSIVMLVSNGANFSLAYPLRLVLWKSIGNCHPKTVDNHNRYQNLLTYPKYFKFQIPSIYTCNNLQ